MPNAFNNHRPRRRAAINITSLIDVMFLLVIFLAVSSTFKSEFGIDVTLPEAGTANVQERAPQEIVLTREGRYLFQGNELDVPGLRALMRQFAAYETSPPIQLRADAAVAWENVLRVMDVAREVGATELLLPTDLEAGTPNDAAPGP